MPKWKLSKEADNDLVNQYVKDRKEAGNPIDQPAKTRSIFNKKAFGVAIKSAWTPFIKLLAFGSTIYTIITQMFELSPDEMKISHWLMWGWFGICGVVFAGFMGWSLYLYYRKKVAQTIGKMEFVVKEADYVVNMIQLLDECAKDRKSYPIFAVGMNRDIVNGDKQGELESLGCDVREFLNDYFSIDILKDTMDCLQAKHRKVKEGDVISMPFEIKEMGEKAAAPFKKLIGCKFSVLFYVNSLYQGDAEVPEVSDARKMVIALMDRCSKYLADVQEGRQIKTVLMIPAINTGETGGAAYKTVLVEILNNLFVPNNRKPNKVIFSLKNFNELENEYSVNELLAVAKKIDKI